MADNNLIHTYNSISAYFLYLVYYLKLEMLWIQS